MLRLFVVLFAIWGIGGNLAARETEDYPTQYTTYPAFHGPAYPSNGNRVEAVTDKGLMKEFIIGCTLGPGIITYSKVEELYCTPDHRCSSGLRSAIDRLC